MSEFEVVHVRDVVLCRDGDHLIVCEVWFLFECNGDGAIVSVWPTKSRIMDQGTVTCRVADDGVKVVPLRDIVCALIYRRREDGTVQVIVPCVWRDIVWV